MSRLRKRGSTRFLLSIIFMVILLFLLKLFVFSDYYSGVKFSEEERTIKIYLEHSRFFADKCNSFYIDGNRLIITEAGVYQLSGIMDDGQIIVDVDKDQEVTLKLNSADITCKDSSPLFVKSADQVVIKLKKGSKNYFRDGASYREVPDGEMQPVACIDSRDDLKIKGPYGTLIVEGNYKHGIHSSDDLKIKSGIIKVYARNTALKGKDSVQIFDGNLSLDAGKDGIYSDEMVKLEKGKIQIKAKRYGIFGKEKLSCLAECQVTIEDTISPLAGNHLADLPESIQIIDENGQVKQGR